MIWLGRQIPELHAAALAANTPDAGANARRPSARRGDLCECGGLMYLGSTLEDASGEIDGMVDVIPGHSKWGNG